MKLDLNKLSRSRSFSLDVGREAFLVSPLDTGFWKGIKEVYPEESYKKKYFDVAGDVSEDELLADRIIMYGVFIGEAFDRRFRFIQLKDGEHSLFACMMYSPEARLNGVVINKHGDIIYLCKDNTLVPQQESDRNQDVVIDLLLDLHPENQGMSTRSPKFLERLKERDIEVYNAVCETS